MLNFDIEILLPYAFILVIIFPFLMLAKHFVHQFIELKKKELSLLGSTNSQVKLQAYERMVIFLERLKPNNLVNRFDENLTAKDFVFLLEKSIKEEFEYNTSQQLYINENSWGDIVNAKNNILHLLQKILEVHPQISAQELKTLFLMHYLEGEDYISDCIQNLKGDIHHLI